jgi:hypothetical protein
VAAYPRGAWLLCIHEARFADWQRGRALHTGWFYVQRLMLGEAPREFQSLCLASWQPFAMPFEMAQEPDGEWINSARCVGVAPSDHAAPIRVAAIAAPIRKSKNFDLGIR